METMQFKNFQLAYVNLLNNVLETGRSVVVRGNQMLEKIPMYFEIEDPQDRLLEFNSRANINKYIFGELLWYLSGSDDVKFIDKYSKVWAGLSDDGFHSNSAYGKYIFSKMPNKGYGVVYDTVYFDYASNPVNFGCQWDYVKSVLQKDPYSRQAVIQIKPIQMYDTKDVTCTFALQFFIRDDKLDMIALMRSNDLIYGTTYDVFMFTFMQELMAAELGLKLGTYKHFASNMHIYMKDLPKVSAILDESFKMPKLLHPIEKDFRQNDLPVLLNLEQSYWSHNRSLTDLDKHMAKTHLSEVGKDLLSLLCDWRA